MEEFCNFYRVIVHNAVPEKVGHTLENGLKNKLEIVF